jgi:hypothetical protein
MRRRPGRAAARAGRPDAQTAYFPGLFAAFTLLGLGAGLSFMPLLGLAMAEVPKPDAGLASGIVNVAMWVSAAIGVAALGTIATDHRRTLAAQGDSAVSALNGGDQLAFTIAAACVAVAAVAALAIVRAPAPIEADAREAEPQRA